MAFDLPPLPYATTALEPYIDAVTMEIHHGKHHAAYVANLNKAIAGYPELETKPIETILAGLDSVPEKIRTAVRNNGGGHYAHTLFWNVMGPNAGGSPTGPLADDIKTTFGSFDAFKEKFEAEGLARFGSGWVWLFVNKAGRLEIASTPNHDSPIMGLAIAGCEGSPIMVCDVWEHAYYLKYQNRRGDFIRAWWNVINWSAVAKFYQAAKRLG